MKATQGPPDPAHGPLPSTAHRPPRAPGAPTSALPVMRSLPADPAKLSAPASSSHAERAALDPRLAMLHQFSAAMVHDMRTPLTVIRYSLDMLRKTVPSTPETAEAIQTMSGELKDLDRALAKLVEVTHEWPFRPQELPLKPILEEIKSRLDPSGQAEWIFTTRPEDFTVIADGPRFTQALRALAQNAFRAMKGRGTIQIIATREKIAPTAPDADGHEQMADVIEITDTGPGIPEQFQDKIFDPFFTTKSPGMGLGLTHCRVVIHRHGGTIDLAETSPAGTTFRIVLPHPT